MEIRQVSQRQYTANKFSITFLLFLLVLFSTGCSGTSKQKSITDADIRKGTDGLVFSFAKNAPPEKIFEGSLFTIALEVKNNGAADSDNALISIGLESAYLKLRDGENPKDFSIKGKSVLNPVGGDDFFTFEGEATNSIGAQSESHKTSILATACYDYKTEFGTSVCIDSDVFRQQRGIKACTVNDIELVTGQGGPVSVTKVETKMMPDKDEGKVNPMFIITIENKGKGEVVSKDKITDACSSKPLKYEDFNEVYLKAFLAGETLDCSQDGSGGDIKARLRDKKDVVRCTLPEGIEKSQDAYTSTLKVELTYGYTQTIAKDIIIEKITTY